MCVQDGSKDIRETKEKKGKRMRKSVKEGRDRAMAQGSRGMGSRRERSIIRSPEE